MQNGIDQAIPPAVTLPDFLYGTEPDNTYMRDMTSVEITQDVGVGWNVGNSLDAAGGETNWENPIIT